MNGWPASGPPSNWTAWVYTTTQGPRSNWTFRKEVDNYALRWLTGSKIADDGDRFAAPELTHADLEEGKGILRKMSVILTVEWFPQSSRMLCVVLGWCAHYEAQDHRRGDLVGHASKKASSFSPRVRINDDALFSELTEKLSFDLELFHYARDLCLQQMIAHGLEVDVASLKPFRHHQRQRRRGLRAKRTERVLKAEEESDEAYEERTTRPSTLIVASTVVSRPPAFDPSRYFTVILTPTPHAFAFSLMCGRSLCSACKNVQERPTQRN